MSGKSTYLRQVALITILSHIGCLVPAKSASMRTVDRLLTNLGSADSLENNSSSFMVEMQVCYTRLHSFSHDTLLKVGIRWCNSDCIPGV